MARRMRGSPFSQNKQLSKFNTIDSYEEFFKIHHFAQTLIPSSVTRVTFNLCIQTNWRVPPSPQWEGYQKNTFSPVGERLAAPEVAMPFIPHIASIISSTVGRWLVCRRSRTAIFTEQRVHYFFVGRGRRPRRPKA